MAPDDAPTSTLSDTDPIPAASESLDPMAEPTFEECVEHHSRYFVDRSAGRIDMNVIPEGHHIAYYEGRIHGHDADPTALMHRVAAKLGVHWARLFIHYPWDWCISVIEEPNHAGSRSPQ
jgi:hypothetical protein